MKTVGKIITAPFRLLTPKIKVPKLPAPLPTARREDADPSAMLDELRKRRGGAADQITGYGGAEPAVQTGKTTLGS
jgi:hypothetical protein